MTRDRDGLHRGLAQAGTEVNRRARRAKNDRLDGDKLLAMLLRWHGGEWRLWSVLKAPTAEQEDVRRVERELDRLRGERTAHMNNRRQLAASVGLTPTPYDSGSSQVEQGISKAGNKRVRSLLVELAWSWLRYQPDSELSRWYQKRFAAAGKRMRRVGIVALARRLVIALWRYLQHGEIPAGAQLKPAAA
jgi:transposase